jgi:hypothetical protein
MPIGSEVTHRCRRWFSSWVPGLVWGFGRPLEDRIPPCGHMGRKQPGDNTCDDGGIPWVDPCAYGRILVRTREIRH